MTENNREDYGSYSVDDEDQLQPEDTLNNRGVDDLLDEGLTGASSEVLDVDTFTGGPGTDLVTTGWGTWGFKAIPAGGEAMAELIATGRPPALIAPFALDRFRRDHVLADQGSAGTR